MEDMEENIQKELNLTPEEVKPKRVRKVKEAADDEPSKYDLLKKEVEKALEFYRSRHKLKSPDDYNYPGFAEMYRIIHS